LGGPATQPVYQVELLTTYTYEVTGFDNAVLVVGYQYHDPNSGTTAGYDVTAIEPGRGEIPVVIALGAGFIDAKGEVMDGVEFFIRINSYDEAVGEWLNLFPGNEPLTVGEQNLANPSAVLTTQTEQTSGQNDVWIISTNVITQTTANGVKADITLVVGYQLSSDYTSGLIRFGSSYESQNSGGGGGSSTPVTPGSGTTEFVFDFETTSWATAKEWLASMSSHLELLGNTVDGAEVLVGETFKIGTD
jgi:hypothetical protein